MVWLFWHILCSLLSSGERREDAAWKQSVRSYSIAGVVEAIRVGHTDGPLRAVNEIDGALDSVSSILVDEKRVGEYESLDTMLSVEAPDTLVQ